MHFMKFFYVQFEVSKLIMQDARGAKEMDGFPSMIVNINLLGEG